MRLPASLVVLLLRCFPHSLPKHEATYSAMQVDTSVSDKTTLTQRLTLEYANADLLASSWASTTQRHKPPGRGVLGNQGKQGRAESKQTKRSGENWEGTSSLGLTGGHLPGVPWFAVPSWARGRWYSRTPASEASPRTQHTRAPEQLSTPELPQGLLEHLPRVWLEWNPRSLHSEPQAQLPRCHASVAGTRTALTLGSGLRQLPPAN